jgi:predicted dehydrogenase
MRRQLSPGHAGRVGERGETIVDVAGSQKRRVALVGTGHRGITMWGRELLADCGDWIEMVGLCDSNPLRLERARNYIGTAAPLFDDLGTMLRRAGPETLVVCSRDSDHDAHIVEALEAGCDVVTEKPMTTTAEKCRRVMEATARAGRRLDVAFNYRCAPTARRLKELLLSDVIGEIASVDFHWYLDTEHGADYFRRWHAHLESSGSLFVHKATHHFDLLNWYLDSEPAEVFARGELRNYGRAGPFRGVRCKTCPHAPICDYHIDIASSPFLELLYEEPSTADNYVRDACVFREEIDIPDTMSATIVYENGVQIAYSLNTFMPIEGYHLALNGRNGRIEIRQYERQPWQVPDHDEILVMRNFGPAKRIVVPHEPGGHFGGDVVLRRMLFEPGTPDPLGQRADVRAGALSVLCGIAARESMRRNRPVSIAELNGLPAEQERAVVRRID